MFVALFFDRSEERAAATTIVFLFSFIGLGKFAGILSGGYIYEIGGMEMIFMVALVSQVLKIVPLAILKRIKE
ncbi:MAG: hypothetical protein ACTSPQ_06320 [Candidatus Helarchaeota archaeon]